MIHRNRTKRPDFFIVGAPRCGTSALAAYLGRHPMIFMPELKDPHFFGRNLHKRPMEFHALDPAQYARMFIEAAPDQRIGEASVLYLLSRTAAGEIKEYSPNAQIIAMLRKPADLIQSLHGDLLWNTWECLPTLHAALEAEPDRRRGLRVPSTTLIREALFYREIVKFAEQLERYYEEFGRNSVHVVIYDDFKSDVQGSVAEVVDFLNLPWMDLGQLDVLNASKVPRIPSLQRYIQRPPAPFAHVLHKLSDRKRLRFLRGLLAMNSRVGVRHPIDIELRKRLVIEMASEVEKLSELLDRDLTHWNHV